MLPRGDLDYLIREQQAELVRRAEQHRLMQEAQRARRSASDALFERIVHKGRLLLMRAVRRMQKSERRVNQRERTPEPKPGSFKSIQLGAVEQTGAGIPASRCGRSEM